MKRKKSMWCMFAFSLEIVRKCRKCKQQDTGTWIIFFLNSFTYVYRHALYCMAYGAVPLFMNNWTCSWQYGINRFESFFEPFHLSFSILFFFSSFFSLFMCKFQAIEHKILKDQTFTVLFIYKASIVGI